MTPKQCITKGDAMTLDSLPSLHTVHETAAKLRCTGDTVYRMIVAGKIKPVRIGRKIFISVEEIARVMGAT